MTGWLSYVGIPFVERGRDRDGVDCWGLFRLFYREQLGIDLPSYRDDYQSTGDRLAILRLVREQLDTGRWESVTEEPAFGDAIVIRIHGQPWHVAVALGDGDMLHSRRGADTCIESLRSVLWRSRIEGFYRYVG